MTTLIQQQRRTVRVSTTVRFVGDAMAPLDELSKTSSSLIANHRAKFFIDGHSYFLPRYLFIGPKGGDEPIRVGLFAAIGGDEPEGTHALVRFLQLLETHPVAATGYCLFIYPVCNPSGFELNTRASRNGKDLLQEFWQETDSPEVRLLQGEIKGHALHGSIALHSNSLISGFGAVARGSLLTRHLAEPALEAGGKFLPVENNVVLDGVEARKGLAWRGEDGLLSAPPGMRPSPFEVALHVPKNAAHYQKEYAFLAALQTILTEYRQFIAYGRNL